MHALVSGFPYIKGFLKYVLVHNAYKYSIKQLALSSKSCIFIKYMYYGMSFCIVFNLPYSAYWYYINIFFQLIDKNLVLVNKGL